MEKVSARQLTPLNFCWTTAQRNWHSKYYTNIIITNIKHAIKAIITCICRECRGILAIKQYTIQDQNYIIHSQKNVNGFL